MLHLAPTSPSPRASHQPPTPLAMLPEFGLGVSEPLPSTQQRAHCGATMWASLSHVSLTATTATAVTPPTASRQTTDSGVTSPSTHEPLKKTCWGPPGRSVHPSARCTAPLQDNHRLAHAVTSVPCSCGRQVQSALPAPPWDEDALHRHGSFPHGRQI